MNWFSYPIMIFVVVGAIVPVSSRAEDCECPEGTTRQVLDGEPGKGRICYCETSDGTLHGPGIGWYPNGVKWRSDYWTNGQKDGCWRIWDETGVLREERFYDAGVQTGTETFWFADGTHKKTVTHFSGGRPHGPVLQWDESGQVVVSGQHEHGQRHGIWALRIPPAPSPRVIVLDGGRDITQTLERQDPSECQTWTRASVLENQGRVALMAAALMAETPAMQAFDFFQTVVCISDQSSALARDAVAVCESGGDVLGALSELVTQHIVDCATTTQKAP